MYPYDYLKDDNGLSVALLAPLVIACFIAKKLPSEIRDFLWKNYWWICAIAFVWFGGNYTENVSVLILFGVIGAFAGLIGKAGFDPKDFRRRDYSASDASKQSDQTIISKGGSSLAQSGEGESKATSEPITGKKTEQPKNGANEKYHIENEFKSGLSSSAIEIVNAQRKIYDEGIWKKEKEKEKEKRTINIKLDVVDNISGFAWRLDRSRGILWNESTKEVLESASGLGFSYAGAHLIIYNRVQPRKILLDEILEAKYK